MLQVISHISWESNWALRIAFADGASGVLELEPIVRTGGVFTPLNDPAFRKRVKIGGGGRFLEWPGEIELCADAIREQLIAESRLA